MGYTGAVARDEEGSFLAACRYKEKATSVAMIEAKAIWHGCMLGMTRGWNMIMVESDSLESISCLKDITRKGSWEAFPVIARCSTLGSGFQDCRWSWAPRSANVAADLLASRVRRDALAFDAALSFCYLLALPIPSTVR
ncbi:uncharacterized protein [Pyrus communis]|uniref:uncharacterized protein n=1 Tax=Pyrus communis TaxID=23211 RepID=UPI0035C20251